MVFSFTLFLILSVAITQISVDAVDNITRPYSNSDPSVIMAKPISISASTKASRMMDLNAPLTASFKTSYTLSSAFPSKSPSKSPSTAPSSVPSKAPSKSPSTSPSSAPSKAPSKSPSTSPSLAPSKAPTKYPSATPSSAPTKTPSMKPSTAPSSASSKAPINLSYRYLSIQITSVRTPTNDGKVQFAEWVFTLLGSRVDYSNAVATWVGGILFPDGATIYGIDNNRASKFGSYTTTGTYTIDFGKLVAIDSYHYITGSDFPGRDPTSWYIFASVDNLHFSPLDFVTSQGSLITTNREASSPVYYPSGNWACPKNQFVSSFSNRGGFWVDALQLECTDGTLSPQFGGTGGSPVLYTSSTGFNGYYLIQGVSAGVVGQFIPYIDGVESTVIDGSNQEGGTTAMITVSCPSGQIINGISSVVYSQYLNSVTFSCASCPPGYYYVNRGCVVQLISMAPTTPSTAPTVYSGSSWTTISTPNLNAQTGLPHLLTDGSVIVIAKTPQKLTPDIYGNYTKGTWTSLAEIPLDYNPLFYASAVLPDGRVVIAGGEYGAGENIASGTEAAIYDPVADSWTVFNAPSFCTSIGDSESVVLADGRWMVGFAYCGNGGILDANSLTWSELNWMTKTDSNDEAGLTLLPDNTILSVLNHGEVYNVSSGTWVDTGNMMNSLVNELGEIGPQVLRPDGTVLVIGSNGVTSIYNYVTKKWTKGPSFPLTASGNLCTVSDGPAALLPNGNVLAMCSTGAYQYGQYQNGPSLWYEFDGTTFHIQKSPPHDPGVCTFFYYMLVLPTGQILQTLPSSANTINFYTPSNMNIQNSWRPTISTLPPAICAGGKSLKISGTQLSGMSHGAAYGDDGQTDTNYPLLRITNIITKHVFYCRTHDHSSVAVQNKHVSFTYFDVPSSIELGPSVIEVVASGVPSLPTQINVVATC